MAQFVFVEARRLISFLAVPARATCCMQLLSGQRSLPQTIFVPFAVGVAVAFTSLASSASFATFKSAAARPLLGAEFYIQTCVCTSMCKYICTARMSVCITPTSATIISWALLCVFLLLFGFVLFCGGTKILLYAFGALAICFKQICLNISRIFRQNVQLSSCVYAPHIHTHTHTFAYIPAVSGLGNVVCA